MGSNNLPLLGREAPAPAELIRYGDEFVERAECVLLVIPSALAPSENNWLINPQHPDFQRITLLVTRALIYDPGLFHHRHRDATRKYQMPSHCASMAGA